MPDNAKTTLPKKALAAFTYWLKQFLYFWSLDNLSSLPERLKTRWQQLLGSYWFIPTTCVLVGILLAPLLVTIDEHLDREAIKEIRFAFTGDDAAARAVMTTIAGAVLGVAGTTFSITIAVLSMASSQFGPRLLRNFLTDTSNQLVLGAFIGTFSYSLLVLKSIHKQEVAFGVPQLAVTFAIVMAICCALLLVYFIQHMVHAIQASHVIQHASDDAMENIDYWYHTYCDIQHQRDIANEDTESYKQWPAVSLYAPGSGYLQQIYIDALIALARDYGGIIQLHTNLGNFVTDRNIIGYFYQRPASQLSHVKKTKTSNLAILSRSPDSNFWQRLTTCVDIVRRSTHSNDIAYSLGQVTEIAVRALSPGTNDPKTAVSCVQSLTVCLSVMMRRQPPSSYHFYTPPHDNDSLDIATNQTRTAILAVITHTPRISDFIDTSLGNIRRYATTDLMVLKILCQAMTDLYYSCVNDAQRQTLLRELTLIERAGRENLAYAELVDDLVAMCEQARQFISNNSSKHQHFEYIGAFSAHIHKALETQSS